jgi:hypothetical protein
VNSACSFGSGVNGGLVAGDSMTQLVNCERMRWRFGIDILTAVVIVRAEKDWVVVTHLIDILSAGTVFLLRKAQICVVDELFMHKRSPLLLYAPATCYKRHEIVRALAEERIGHRGDGFLGRNGRGKHCRHCGCQRIWV